MIECIFEFVFFSPDNFTIRPNSIAVGVVKIKPRLTALCTIFNGEVIAWELEVLGLISIVNFIVPRIGELIFFTLIDLGPYKKFFGCRYLVSSTEIQ